MILIANRYTESKMNIVEASGEEARLAEAKKDPAHFKFFYEKYFRSIFTFIYRRTDDEELTADLTSQVFLKAMQKIGKFEFRGLPFSAWLYRIAANEVTQYYRDNKKIRVVSMEYEDMHEILEDEDASFETVKDEALSKAFENLNEEELELIEMRFFEKRAFKEIGDIKGITENNAKVKVYRIVDKLKSFITVQI
jgi:RNA polymerase sigma-70 factor (ECF subfamily)